MISVILAGGKGLRLWPESRQKRPKQLCKLTSSKSMLDDTIDRLVNAGSERIVIITSDELAPAIEKLLNQRKDNHFIEILTEPQGKNTAPAVGLVLARYLSTCSDKILGIFPADHHVLDIEGFSQTLLRAQRAAQYNHLATIGISPTRPETGYGYIEKTKWEIADLPDVYQVSSFCEKPDLPTANNYFSSGQHMWNAGIYVGKGSVFMEEFRKYLPDVYNRMILGYDEYIHSYDNLPDISLDYGIAEKSDRMAVIPANFGWSDLGSWNALAELKQQDDNMNVCCGNDVIVVESHNCLVKQAEKTVVLFGVDNLLVVETDDVIFISQRDRSQDVRQIVENLKQNNRFDLL
ncbi:MAG: mannose-1-phosphate guanylyltransferase [Syntrophomonadaceae bacterium]|jgi:mannose-1-phosphate guanylyltransferase/mannose-6-phosphate isomerase